MLENETFMSIKSDISSNKEINKKNKISQHDSKYSFSQILNMNLGFLGIQFAWGLQMANMSAIFEYLGADAHQLPILWIAAPLTGLIIQPIIGNLSDYTWTSLGRRKPYFLGGAILGAIALLLMPHSSTLWMAALLLWLLDSSANISMVPFRAFVGDLLPKEQRTKGFAIQSVMVGMGAISASTLPWILSHLFPINNTSNAFHQIPPTVEYSFYVGGILFLTTVIWTVITTPEYPPQNLEKFELLQAQRGGIVSSIKESWQSVQNMPSTMTHLAKVQFFTWLGIFCFFLYFPPSVAHNIFGATEQGSLLYSEGIEWAGLCFALFNGVCIVFSFLLPNLSKKCDRLTIHCLCLLCGGVSLISLLLIDNKYLLLFAMIGFGIAWASALVMPYAMLTESIPSQRRGIYQGIFNFFIVLPEIAISLCFGWIMNYFLHDNHLLAVVLGGFFLIIASVLTTAQFSLNVEGSPTP